LKKNFFIFFSLFLLSSTYSQELKLWYNKPAAKWTEALPIGNGRIGAMIFGGIERDRIQFNEETLWTGEPREYNRKGAYKYLPQIRQLLLEGAQKEAEALAEKEFMGLKSSEGKNDDWIKKMTATKEFASSNFDDSQWKNMQVPSYEGWEAAGFEGLDGAVWLRTNFDLPASWQGKDLVLDLNRIRDLDHTYINGKLVGSMESTEPRKYKIPKDVLVKGRNIIAVQVLNFFDKGGIAGYKDTSRHIGIYPSDNEASKLSLNASWKYFIQDDSPPAVPRYQADYQPFGDLWLNFKTTNARDYRR